MTSRQRDHAAAAKAARRARCRAPPGGSRDIGGRGSTGHVGIGARGVGEVSQMQQNRLGSEAHDGDGGDVGETAARVATVTMNVA